MRKLGFITLFLVLMVIFLSFLLYYNEIKSFSQIIILSFGFSGLFLMVVFMDTIIQPISPDILVFGATFSGADLGWAFLVGGVASCLAGIFGYYLGGKAGVVGFKRWFGKEHLAKGKNLFNKYGVWAVVVGALSPIPYSSVCWTAGIYKMDFLTFLITSLLTRIPRFFLMGLIGSLL